MPVYNCEKYIAEAIESVLHQTFSDFEFIIINDGSTDSTERIVRSYANKDDRIIFINNAKNSGVTDALNQGLDLCRGEYIARMDGDDISLPQRFEKQVEYMDKHPDCGVLGTWFQIFDGQNVPIYYPTQIKAFDLLCGICVCHPTVMLRKSVMDRYGFKYNQEYKHAEDFALWSKMVFVTEIHNLPKVLLYYRWTDQNVSMVHMQEQRAKTESIKHDILNLLTNDNTLQTRIMDVAGGKTGIILPRWLGRLCGVFIFNRKKRNIFIHKYFA